MRALRGRISGLCQPTYVLDIPGGYGKVPIGPNYLTPLTAPRVVAGMACDRHVLGHRESRGRPSARPQGTEAGEPRHIVEDWNGGGHAYPPGGDVDRGSD
jgi:hypothetical protein